MVRLLATMSSGALAWFITGYAMRNTGVPPMDWLLSFTPLAVLFTAFAVGGVANAVNIIDGFNGLAAGAVAIMLAALGLIALNVGDLALSAVCFAVAVEQAAQFFYMGVGQTGGESRVLVARVDGDEAVLPSGDLHA